MEYITNNSASHSFDWLALFAIVVSVFSLLYSIFYNRKTFRLTESHNKKMVEPCFTTWYTADSDIDNYSFESFEIKNCGFGPAIILSCKFIYEGKDYSSILDIPSEKININDYSLKKSIICKLKNAVFASNESRYLFKLYFARKNGFENDCYYAALFREFAKKVGFEIKYKNVYDNEEILRIPSITD